MANPKAKSKVRAVPRKAARLRKGERVPPSNKIALRAPSLPRNPYELNEEHVTLLKNTIAKGATDLELQLFLATAKRHRLDPFTHQIWLVPRWDKSADSGQRDRNNQPILGAYVRTTQIGIDGFLYIAARDHKNFGSISRPEYGPITAGHPEWAVVKAFKKGIAEPTIAEVYWEEYAPTDLSKAPFWRKMPRRMLSKCATALALRQAYPETFSGIYIPEECEKMAEDFTPEGRKLTEVPADPYLKQYLDGEREDIKKLTPAQQEVLARRMAERPQDSPTIASANEAGAEPSKPATGAPALFYRYFKESNTYQVEGPEHLCSANRDLLKPLWNKTAGAIVCTATQLGKLISELERRKVPIRAKE